MNKNSISQLAKDSNRIIVTQQKALNIKRKKGNIVIADIQDNDVVNRFAETIEIDTSTKAAPGWMMMPEIYINFMNNKTLIFSFGILIGYWIRSNQWEGDYIVHNHNWLHEWLLENGVSSFQRRS
ncbi:hypothetical protein [Pleionea sp. CnH1-48]|uniref:hypothetical protein n=1 Tax=Pleionea sp. CnH1-48 TaxID=2954494 RepID=UPI0020969C42|nr:hypothetical protein [Pleionea sp. CnH1-48]MCO7222717.1 hypothetical protein [Pleionea sp. CnH1-48]